MPVGTVKWFDAKKGFGFLIDGRGVDIFVHYSVIEGDGFRRLLDGEQVEFDCDHGPKGMLATRVRRLNALNDGPPKAQSPKQDEQP